MNCNLKTKLQSGSTCLGAWVSIGHPDVADLLEALGFDWLVFDTEHAPLGPESVSRMIQAIDGEKVCPLVRVGVVGQYPIKSALDMGAHGVVCPMVSTAEDAQDAVRFVKYPPDGIRGVGPRKASNYGLNTSEYVRTANEWTIVAAQIETTQALENLERILSVKGIDIGFVGPADLSMSLGHFFDRSNPKVTEAMKAVIASCETHRKVPGILAANPEEAKQALSLGFRFVALGSDFRYLISGAKSFLDSVRTR